MFMPARIAWYRNTECIASRTGSLPRNEKETLLTPPLTMRVRAALADLRRRLDEVERVAVVLLDAGGDREDVRVEDDVLGRQSRPLGQQLVAALADRDLALDGVGLALLVEGHDHDRGAVGAHRARLLEELLPRLP